MTEHTVTPDADDHSSLVGGSTAGRRLECPGSYHLEQKLPPRGKEIESSFAAEGTALHECMGHILEKDITDPDEVVGMEFYGHAMDRDLVAETIVPCMAFFENLYEETADEGDFRFVVEKRCEMPGIPEAFGTADLIIGTDERTIICDWKFGAGKPVYAGIVQAWGDDGKPKIVTGNPQLMFYARAAKFTHPEFFGEGDDWPVDLYIAQPRIDPSRGEQKSHYATTIGELEEFRSRLISKISEAKGIHDRGSLEGVTFTEGPHCDWCACKTICPAHTGPMLDLAAIEHETPLDSPEIDELSDEGYAAHLVNIMALGELLEPCVKEAKQQAVTLIEDGIDVPGYKLVNKKPSHDKWMDDKAAEKYLGRAGIPLAERRIMKVMTPAKAREALKKIDKKLAEKHVKKGTSSGVNLVHEHAKGEAVLNTKQIADKLKQALGA